MIRPLLSQLRRRLMFQAFFRAWAYAALAAGGLLLLGVAIRPLPDGGTLGLAALALAVFAALAAGLWTGLHRPGLMEVAVRIDRVAETRDRLATALAFENETAASPLHRAALAECEAFLAKFDGRRWTPWRMPRLVPWLLVPVAAVALQFWVRQPFAPGDSRRQPDSAVLRTADELERMAKRLEEQKKDQPDAELQKVAEALRQSANQLKAEAAGESPEKAALRELSALEELLQATRKADSPENFAQALAEAFAGVDAAREAAEALRKHGSAAAAEKLEELAKRLAENRSPADRQLQEAMAELARKLGAQSALGKAAAKAAAAAGRGDGKGAGEAVRQMAQAMRESGSPGAAGKNSQSLQRMISALREMKSGGQPGQPQGGAPESGKEGDSRITMVEAPEGGQPGSEPATGATDTPGGQPGNELDEGSKASALGKERAAPGEAGMQAQLHGILGEGESLQSLLPAAPGEEPAGAGYKALYEAAAPALEDSLDRENIPLGSRLFIKRYFESIRPK